MTGVTTRRARAIPRSVLYTPALSLDVVAKAWSYDADVHLIDLEDAVPEPDKDTARLVCREALAKAPRPENVAVRVNALSTIEAAHDLVLLAGCPVKPGFVVMTMVDSPVEVRLVRAALASAGVRPEIYATVETPVAVADADAIAAAADGLIFGSADLAASLGVDITWAAMLAARQAMATACARHGAGCVDTANFRLGEPGALGRELGAVRELGFHGKATVHPSELDEINRALRPGPDDLRRARRVIEAVRVARGGVAMLDGDMVGPPFARRARDTVALGEAWGERFGPRDASGPAHHAGGQECGHDGG